MGFDTNFKDPHITDNYYRFRQTPVREGGEYRTGKLDGDKVIYQKGNGTMIMHPHRERMTISRPTHGKDESELSQHAFSVRTVP